LVVVGKAAAIKPGLEAYGPVTVVDTDGNAIVTPEMAKQPSAQTAPAAAPAPAASPAATPAKAK
jgi:hypothetical protein